MNLFGLFIFFAFNLIFADDEPISLTKEERLLAQINNPVVLNYAVRPQQMLLLLEHD